VAGSLQKVIDLIKIDLSKSDEEQYDFIHPEKVPHIKGSEYLIQIIESIKNKRCLRVYYQPFYEDKPYFTEIHPYLLKEYKNRWYMIGMNDFKQQLRTYSLDRIRSIEESGLKFIESSFNASEYFKYSLGIISPEGKAPIIRLKVQNTQAQYMISQPWHDSQNIEEESENGVIFSFKLHPTYEFIQLVLSYGKDIKVLGPQSLIYKIKNELDVMISYYKDH